MKDSNLGFLHVIYLLILIFIDCIGVTLVNKIIRVSCVRFHNTSSV